MKRVIILGATGSVGRNVLDVIAQHRDRYHVTALVAGRDVDGLVALAKNFKPDCVALADEAYGPSLSDALSGQGIESGAGRSAIMEAVRRECDLVVAGIVGTAGLEPTFAAVELGRTIALANKECLVSAGAAFMAGVSRHGAKILPLDSEHNALFQILEGHDRSAITRMILTASGGPFRGWSKEQINQAGPDAALLHPNWSMGPKISIDSASLMNKGLELIEAHHLFGLSSDRLDVLVHPQSIVHGLVSFKDGSLLAGMAAPDMRVPAAHCLAYPQRLSTEIAAPDLAELGSLHFEKADLDRFPCLHLAMEAMRMDGIMPCVLNAANEVAVEAFLGGGYRFDLIARLVEHVMDQAVNWQLSPHSIADCLEIDQKARALAYEILERKASFWAH
jgi:1-deoxy-D-xylulose-5-phosphate reductoisomerase